MGFGGDLSRIKLQQQFLGSLMRKMKSSDTLTSPTKMFKLAEAATKALTVDTGIGNISKLKDLGLELGKVDVEEHHLHDRAGASTTRRRRSTGHGRRRRGQGRPRSSR